MVLCQVISSPSSSTTVAGAAMEGQDSVYDGDPVTEALLSDECDDLSPSDPVTSTQPYTGATESQQQPEPQSGNQSQPRLAFVKQTGLKLYRGWFVQELKKLLKLAIPITLSLLFQYLLLWISLLFVGHLPDRDEIHSYQYTGAGLGSAFINVTGLALGHGLATASDTLSSQAFGYKNYKRIGVILQRGILILGLVMFPTWAVWLNTESLLLLVQQPPCVAKFSGLYVNIFTLALPFLFLQILLQHYLQSQSIVWQFVLIGFAANVISVILHAITIYGIRLGFTGAVVSLVISNMLPPLMVIGYVWFHKLHKETWGGWSLESLEEWWLFIKLAVPGMLMLVLEWSSIEIVNFLAGALGEMELAVNIIWYQLLVLPYMPCLGFTVSISIRVGNELGAGNPQGAKRAAFTAIAFIFIQSLLLDIVILSTKDVIALVFVQGNEEIAQRVSTLMYVAVFYVCSDQVQSVIGGVLRGCGQQYIGAIVNFIAYYVIGLPVGAVIGFKTDLGVLGIWLGMLAGNVVQCVIFVVVLLRTNWQKQSDKAIKRAHDSSPGKVDEIDSIAQDVCASEQDVSSSSSSSLSSREEESEDAASLLQMELEDVQREDKDVDLVVSPPREALSYKIRKLFLHGSLFVVGVCFLVAGGVASRYHPYVDPEEYSNCTHGNVSDYSIDTMRLVFDSL